MKKIIVVVLILFMVGCSKTVPYIEINFNDFKNKLENKESFIFYIGATHCPFCERYEQSLKKVVKNNKIDIFYLDTDKLDEGSYKELSNLVNFSGTPYTTFIKEGEITSRYNSIEGAVSYDKIIRAFKRNGYIK